MKMIPVFHYPADIFPSSVHKIVEARTELVRNNFVRYYKVEWKPQWIPEVFLQRHCGEFIHDFWKSKKKIEMEATSNQPFFKSSTEVSHTAHAGIPFHPTITNIPALNNQDRKRKATESVDSPEAITKLTERTQEIGKQPPKEFAFIPQRNCIYPLARFAGCHQNYLSTSSIHPPSKMESGLAGVHRAYLQTDQIILNNAPENSQNQAPVIIAGNTLPQKINKRKKSSPKQKLNNIVKLESDFSQNPQETESTVKEETTTSTKRPNEESINSDFVLTEMEIKKEIEDEELLSNESTLTAPEEDDEYALDWTSSEEENTYDPKDEDFEPSNESEDDTYSEEGYSSEEKPKITGPPKPKKPKKEKLPKPMYRKEIGPPLKCFECGKEHMKETCPRCARMKTCEVCQHKYYAEQCGYCCNQCDKCGKRFRRPSQLRRHVDGVHEKIEKHKCKICNQGFVSASTLVQHYEGHKEEADLVCKTCKKAFKFVASYRRHLKIHSGVKEYKCETCGREFNAKNNMKTHMLLHTTGPKRFQCRVCPKDFHHKVSLKEHMGRQHSIEEKRATDMAALWKDDRKLEGSEFANLTDEELYVRALKEVIQNKVDENTQIATTRGKSKTSVVKKGVKFSKRLKTKRVKSIKDPKSTEYMTRQTRNRSKNSHADIQEKLASVDSNHTNVKYDEQTLKDNTNISTNDSNPLDVSYQKSTTDNSKQFVKNESKSLSISSKKNQLDNMEDYSSDNVHDSHVTNEEPIKI